MMFPFKNDCAVDLFPLKEADDEAFYQIKGTFDLQSHTISFAYNSPNVT